MEIIKTRWGAGEARFFQPIGVNGVGSEGEDSWETVKWKEFFYGQLKKQFNEKRAKIRHSLR